MRIVHVEHPDDPRLAGFSSLAQPDRLRERGLFVAEGRLVVARVLADPRWRVEAVLLSDAAFAAMKADLSLAADCPVFVCPADYFRTVTGFNIHRGCLALVHRPAPRRAEALLARARLVVVLEAVANPDNIGGVFRNAAAFGADAVLLSPACCDPLYRKAIRTAMGATLRVPFAAVTDWPDVLGAVKASGFHLVALTPHPGAQSLDAFVAAGRPDRTALLIGSEGAGLSTAAARAADTLVRIPISDAVDSLNLAVAAGIALERLSHTARTARLSS